MSFEQDYDAIIIGGGIIGSCCGYKLSNCGKKTLILEQVKFNLIFFINSIKLDIHLVLRTAHHVLFAICIHQKFICHWPLMRLKNGI